jgi:hypothetical protein
LARSIREESQAFGASQVIHASIPVERVTSRVMSEIVFVVEQAPEGGYTARAVGESIFTETDDLAQLHARAREAVRCHFDEGKAPKLIRLQYVRDEVIPA